LLLDPIGQLQHIKLITSAEPKIKSNLLCYPATSSGDMKLSILETFKSRLLNLHNPIGWEGEDLIQLPQDKDQWQAPVNTVMNLRIP